MIETLTTDRLTMRPFVSDDLDPLVALHADESFWWYPLRRAMTFEETADFLTRVMTEYQSKTEPSLHAVVEKSTGTLLGWGGLSVPRFLPEVLPAVEVEWRLGSEFRGRGLATELGAAALRWGFTSLSLDRIISIFEPENVASGKVVDHLGFACGTTTMHPRGWTVVVRTLTAEQWRSNESWKTAGSDALSFAIDLKRDRIEPRRESL